MLIMFKKISVKQLGCLLFLGLFAQISANESKEVNEIIQGDAIRANVNQVDSVRVKDSTQVSVRDSNNVTLNDSLTKKSEDSVAVVDSALVKSSLKEASDSLHANVDLDPSAIATDKSHGALWYTGISIGGAGIVSLVLASHFDGLAAKHRNHAARLYEEGKDGNAYKSAYNETQDLEDKSKIFMYTGGALFVVGIGIIGYELYNNANLGFELKPNGLEMAMRF